MRAPCKRSAIDSDSAVPIKIGRNRSPLTSRRTITRCRERRLYRTECTFNSIMAMHLLTSPGAVRLHYTTFGPRSQSTRLDANG